MKRCWTSLIIKEMQVKTIMRYDLTTIKMSANKESSKIKCWNGCGGNGNFLHCWCECKLVQPLWRTVWWFLYKTEDKIAIQASNHTAGHTHRGNQNGKKHVYLKDRKWKQPRCPLADEWIRKPWYIHTMEYCSIMKRIRLNLF